MIMEKQRWYLLIMSLFLFAGVSLGQIVNGGFELWEQVEGSSKATGWSSKYDFRGIDQSSSRTNGQFALQFLPCPSNLGVWQYGDVIYQTITSFGEEGDSLYLRFNVKAVSVDPENTGLVFATLFVDYYRDGISHHRDSWLSTEEIPTFTTVELKLHPIPADSIRITLAGGGVAAPHDGPSHCSNVWFDDLVLFDTDCENRQNSDLTVGPNPTWGYVYLQMDCSDIEHIMVFDISGKQILSEQLNTSFYELDLSPLPSGAYIISFLREDQQVADHRKIIKW